MWDLWWTKWLWDGFSPSTSVSLANLHSTNFLTITITFHPGLIVANSGRSANSLTNSLKKKESYRMCIKDYEIEIGGQGPVRAVELLGEY
jgi:hypothetical protein